MFLTGLKKTKNRPQNHVLSCNKEMQVDSHVGLKVKWVSQSLLTWVSIQTVRLSPCCASLLWRSSPQTWPAAELPWSGPCSPAVPHPHQQEEHCDKTTDAMHRGERGGKSGRDTQSKVLLMCSQSWSLFNIKYMWAILLEQEHFSSPLELTSVR